MDLHRFNHTAVPSAVFTDPQLAGVGLTEQQARARGIRFVCATQDFGGTAFGWAMEDTTGACKVLADPETGCLLGAHLMGPYASTLIQPLIQAMAFGQHVHDVARNQYWIHPALNEVVENALLRLDVDHRPRFNSRRRPALSGFRKARSLPLVTTRDEAQLPGAGSVAACRKVESSACGDFDPAACASRSESVGGCR